MLFSGGRGSGALTHQLVTQSNIAITIAINGYDDGASTGEVRRFLVGPKGCEITGITWSPDYRAMWINVQHPGLSYPASDGQTRARSTTVLVTRDDGGVIGA